MLTQSTFSGNIWPRRQFQAYLDHGFGVWSSASSWFLVALSKLSVLHLPFQQQRLGHN